jgi:hypothetical protein
MLATMRWTDGQHLLLVVAADKNGKAADELALRLLLPAA